MSLAEAPPVDTGVPDSASPSDDVDEQVPVLEDLSLERNDKRSSVPSFEKVVVQVPSAVIRTDAKGNHFTAYNVVVTIRGAELWRIEKRFSAFHELDQQVRRDHRAIAASIPRLPDKVLFKRLSPATVDDRKVRSFREQKRKVSHWTHCRRLLRAT